MTIKDDVTNSIENILDREWNEREGRVVPDAEDVALADGAVKVDATFLYADLAGSSKLAKVCPWQTTAKIIRAYLDAATRIIRHNGGYIRSFDGDRVMGVFMGDYKNSSAVTAARNIDWTVTNLLNAKAQRFDSIKNNEIKIRHCVGVDTGTTRAVRAGIRNNNDLIWIGKAPSFAAKLSDIRSYPYEVFASYAVYNAMDKKLRTKAGGDSIWIEHTMNFAGENVTVVKTCTTLELG